MHIKSLADTTRAEVRALAQAAADSSEPLTTANVFPPESLKNRQFAADYHERLLVLEAVS